MDRGEAVQKTGHCCWRKCRTRRLQRSVHLAKCHARIRLVCPFRRPKTSLLLVPFGPLPHFSACQSNVCSLGTLLGLLITGEASIGLNCCRAVMALSHSQPPLITGEDHPDYRLAGPNSDWHRYPSPLHLVIITDSDCNWAKSSRRPSLQEHQWQGQI